MKKIKLLVFPFLLVACSNSIGNQEVDLKNNKKMNEKAFWAIVDKINWTKEDDGERVAPAVEILSNYEVKEIYKFDDILSEKLFDLDGKKYAQNIAEEDSYGNTDGYFSADYFLYVRCCVVANGKVFYEKVKKDPSKMPKGLDFEPLLYLGAESFMRKTGQDMDSYYESWEPKFNYETYSNNASWK